MKCPECDTKIKSKHYDPEFEWYECPKCEGCFTADEIIKDEATKTRVAAKGKKRRTEIQEDEAAIAKFEEESLKPVKVAREKKHRDEAPTVSVISTWAAELQTVYEELGGRLDDENAKDKALTLWRQVHIHDGVEAREQAVEHSLCGEHE